MVRFRYALAGPPTSWVPPRISHSPIPPSSVKKTTHIPLERGGAGAGRGEGLVDGRLGVVEGEIGSEGEVGGGGMGGGRM